MTSLLNVVLATDAPTNSEPESLDSLDFDDWEGQFEFVGNNNSNRQTKNSDTLTTTTARIANDLEDLNLTVPQYNETITNRPILIDEETFLSLQLTDNDSLKYDPANDDDANIDNEDFDNQPSSLLIENALNHINFDHSVPSNLNDKEYSTDDIIHTRNRLNQQQNNKKNSSTHRGDRNNNHQCNDKMNKNRFTNELCDSLLKEQLEILQRQVSTLADSQSNAEDRTSRTKTEYAVLQARYHMLEEQLRDVELRAEERISEEQKRHRELLARIEREAILQSENCQIKIRTIEVETNSLRDELQRLRTQYDKQTVELRATEEKLEDARDNLTMAREELAEAKENEKKYLGEKLAAEDLMLELGKEIERLRSESGPAMPTTSPETLRQEELQQELENLRQEKKSLIEHNEELQAMILTRGVEEGRNLLNGTSNSLAQELDELNDRQLQLAYQEQEEENVRLKHYIDTILLNIVENYPQILEVKTSEKR